jgi:hypothetical protein
MLPQAQDLIFSDELTSGVEMELTSRGEMEYHETPLNEAEVQLRRSTRSTQSPIRLRYYVTCKVSYYIQDL